MKTLITIALLTIASMAGTYVTITPSDGGAEETVYVETSE